MSYTDLLKGICSESNRAYFITVVTYQRKPIFNDLYCARELVQCFKSAHDSGDVISLSWVIMPDHFHWLVQLVDKSLPSLLNQLKGVSSRKINNRLKLKGALWQKSYYDRAIRDSQDVKGVARYIVANPLRSGLVQSIGDYSHWDALWL